MGRVALALLAVGAALAALSFQKGWQIVSTGDWTAFAYIVFAWLAVAIALVAFGVALVAAAFGWGRLPRWAIAPGGALLLVSATVSVASLPATGVPLIVGVVALASLAGLAASVFAWRRAAPAA
jgi:hypothetical protein